MKYLIAILLCTFCTTSALSAEPIRILAWNIESGGSDTGVIINQLKTVMPEYDILALSEVPSGDIGKIADALGWKHFAGSRGGEDRLMIAWSDRFEAGTQTEIRKVGDREMPGGNNRSPLVVELKEANGNTFMVMNNHLTRGNESNRNLQAELLVEWARNTTTTVFAVGDYNMDYDFNTMKGNAAFDLMQKDSIWKWIQPNELIDTNWADPDKDGMDNYPDSMLDFVFVANLPTQQKIACEVIVLPDDFPDDRTTSDHRPVLTTIETTAE